MKIMTQHREDIKSVRMLLCPGVFYSVSVYVCGVTGVWCVFSVLYK